MSFGALLETAMAGSQRQDPHAALPALNSLPAETRLLRSASYEGLRRLAGRPLDLVEDVIGVDPAGPEVLPPIPPVAGARLLEILAYRPELLFEWLGLAAAKRWRVSPDGLSDLLEHARTRPEIQELVMQVGGERLDWLAGLNPDWHFARRADPEGQLDLGTPIERARALRRIRRQDPARGRALLVAILNGRSERAETRSAMLEALTDGLSAEDETLVQEAIKDPRKDVREHGLRLIRRIPGSRFSRRWTARARQLVRVSDVGRIEVIEPGEPDPAWIDDGLDPRPPKGIGATAWILQQTLAFAPPSIWPPATLAAIARSDWSQPLVSGLAGAAAAYADADWCEDLLVAWASATQNRQNLPLNAKALFGALAPERAEAVFVRLLDIGAPWEAALIASSTHAWSLDFSRRIMARLPELIEKWQHTAGSVLQTAPLRLDPRVLPEAERLREIDIKPSLARPAVLRLVTTLTFRLAMRQELEPATPDCHSEDDS